MGTHDAKRRLGEKRPMITLLIAVGALAVTVISNAIIRPSTRPTPSQISRERRWPL
jgi:hypothetical protein